MLCIVKAINTQSEIEITKRMLFRTTVHPWSLSNTKIADRPGESRCFSGCKTVYFDYKSSPMTSWIAWIWNNQPLNPPHLLQYYLGTVPELCWRHRKQNYVNSTQMFPIILIRNCCTSGDKDIRVGLLVYNPYVVATVYCLMNKLFKSAW